MKKYYFTSESVTEGHPDKLCDYISDSILDEYLKQDSNSRVAVETLASANKIIIAGQITSKASIDIEQIVRDTIKEIGYDNEKTDIDYRNCDIEINITRQSPNIAQGVDIGGAGDQGIMFGYATDETASYMPLAIDMAHRLAKRLTEVRKQDEVAYLRPDRKNTGYCRIWRWYTEKNRNNFNIYTAFNRYRYNTNWKRHKRKGYK